MFKTALKNNKILHTWMLANIVPMPKPNNDTDKGTSYKPIFLLSVFAKTLEKSLPPYITANIPNTPMQHGYKTQHSKMRTLHTSIQRQFKNGVPQCGVLLPTLFNLHTSDVPPPITHVQVMAYVDDITITSTHTSTSAENKYIQQYLHTGFAWTKHNNLTLNSDKRTCTQFIPDSVEYTSNLDLNINNTALPMAAHTKVLGLTLDPKLTYSRHIHNISVLAHNPLQLIKTLIATGWRKQKEKNQLAPYTYIYCL